MSASNFYNLPTSYQIRQVGQVFIASLKDDSPFDAIFPEESTEEWLLRWFQQDIYTGMQAPRGIGGRPPRVQMVSENEFIQSPGVYGEHITLDEEDLTLRRKRAGEGNRADIADLVGKAVKQLIVRRVVRQKYMKSQLAINGTFTSTDKLGNVIDTASFTPQTFPAAVPWDTLATATPLQDIRAMCLTFVGKSVRADSTAQLWMNRPQVNAMLNNTNASDLGGKKMLYGKSVFSLEDANEVLLSDDLPQIRILEDGWYDDTKTFNRFIPTGKALMVCKRVDGEPIGGFRYAPNINSPGAASQPYMRVIDRSSTEIPGEVEVHDGFNGGLVLYFPSALLTMTNLHS